MVRVSIDVDAAAGIARRLRAFVDDAGEERTGVGQAAARSLCATDQLDRIEDALVAISGAAEDLQTRVELAIACNTGAHGTGPTTGVLSFDLAGGDVGMAAVKTRLGIEIAQGIEGLDSAGRVLHRDDVVRFERYTALLEKYDGDSLVTGALFAELGPKRTVNVPVMLKNFAETYELGLRAAPEEDVVSYDGTAMAFRIGAAQKRFIETYRTGLATATTSREFQDAQPNFGTAVAKAVLDGGGAAGWGLNQILRRGVFGSAFLTDLGTGLYDSEQRWSAFGIDPVWSEQADVSNWRLGAPGEEMAADPFVGLLGAMGRSPQSAADFLNPDGGGADAQARGKYLIRDRAWTDDGFNALGEALDAAATSFHGSNASPAMQAQSAWVASATVHYLGGREPVGDGGRVGESAKDSIGHILASYIVDVDRVASGVPGKPGVFHPNQFDPWMVGQPAGAGFEAAALRNVLSDVLTDDRALTQVANANAAWNAHRINYAAEHWSKDDLEAALMETAVKNSSKTTGFILGAMGVGLKDKARDADDRAKMFLDLASGVVGMVPAGGRVTSFAVDQALSAGKNDLVDRWAGNESRVAREQLIVRDVASSDLQMAVAVAMAENDHLPAKVGNDDPRANMQNVRCAWFPIEGGFDSGVMVDPAVRSDFQDWLNSHKPGMTIKTFLDLSSDAFKDGVSLSAEMK